MITGPEISSGSRLPNTDASSSWHCLCGKHSTVTVQSRTSPGINKPGGVGRIISRTDGFCEVKYCVNGGTEKDIDLCYVACYVEEAAGRGRRERQARTLMNIEQEEVQRKKKAAKKIKMTPKLDGEENNVCPKNSTHSFSKKPDKKRPNSNKNKIMTGKIEMGGRECSTALEDISNKPCPDATRGYTIIQPPQWEQKNETLDLSLDGEQVVAVLEKTRAAAPPPPPPPPPALPPAAVRAAVLAALERGGGEAPVAALAAACIDAGTVSCESELRTMLMDLESAGKLMLSDGMVYEI